MPTGLFEAYIDQLDAVTAERMLAMAEAALYAQLTPESARKWHAAVVKRVTPVTRRVQNGRMRDVPHHRSSLFFWNGQAVEPLALKQRLAARLRSGFSADA